MAELISGQRESINKETNCNSENPTRGIIKQEMDFYSKSWITAITTFIIIIIIIIISDHISLHAALCSLSNLTELHITFQLRFIGIEYRRDQFQFTNNDAKNLARGLQNCVQLKVFRYVHKN